MGGQVVDTQSAEEFMRETLEKVSREELLSVAELLDTKAAGFRALLGQPGQARSLDRSDLRRVLRSIFATRRKVDAILDGVGPERLGAAIDDLLHGPSLVTERFRVFDAVLADHPEQAFDLPSELLHFTFPDRWWLWTRWMWDPRAGTGSLPLVTKSEIRNTTARRCNT